MRGTNNNTNDATQRAQTHSLLAASATPGKRGGTPSNDSLDLGRAYPRAKSAKTGGEGVDLVSLVLDTPPAEGHSRKGEMMATYTERFATNYGDVLEVRSGGCAEEEVSDADSKEDIRAGEGDG